MNLYTGSRCARSLQFDSSLTYNSKLAPHRVRSTGHLFDYQNSRSNNNSSTTNSSFFNSRSQNIGQNTNRASSSSNNIDKQCW